MLYSGLCCACRYTAVGGKDIVSGHACVNLAQKLQARSEGCSARLALRGGTSRQRGIATRSGLAPALHARTLADAVPLGWPPAVPQIFCDGRRVALPPDIEGLMVLNINSYMGGSRAWACQLLGHPTLALLVPSANAPRCGPRRAASPAGRPSHHYGWPLHSGVRLHCAAPTTPLGPRPAQAASICGRTATRCLGMATAAAAEAAAGGDVAMRRA